LQAKIAAFLPLASSQIPEIPYLSQLQQA